MSDLRTFRAMLKSDRHSLDTELEMQADVFDRISQRVVQLGARVAEAKDQLSRTEARLLSDIADNAPSKMTVAQIDAQVKRHQDRRDDWSAYQQAISEHAEWENLREAWKQKGYSLKTLADLYSSNYFSATSHTPRHNRGVGGMYRHDQDYQEGRQILKEHRQSSARDTSPPVRRRLTGG